MYDGSDPSLEDNPKTAVPLLDLCRDNEIILEVEMGVVGGRKMDSIASELRRKNSIRRMKICWLFTRHSVRFPVPVLC